MSDSDPSQIPLPPPHPFTEQTKKPRRGIKVTALVVAMLLALGLGALNLFGAPVPGSNTTGTTKAPPATTFADASWPKNMASGGLAFTNNQGTVTPILSAAPASGTAPKPLTADGQAAHLIQLYVDYRCPYCSLFEQTNQATIEELVLNQSTTLEIHPLTFLDRVSDGSYYSSRASGALACVANSQPQNAWATHTALMSEEFQPEENTVGRNNAEVITRLDQASGGLTDETRSCIIEERFVPFVQALNEWTFLTSVPGAQDPNLKVTGTPLAVVDGVPYTGDLGSAEAFRAFVQKQGITLSQ